MEIKKPYEIEKALIGQKIIDKIFG